MPNPTWKEKELAAELEMAKAAGVVMAAFVLGAHGKYTQGTVRMNVIATALEVLRDASSPPFGFMIDEVLEEFDTKRVPAQWDEALMAYWNRLVAAVEAGIEVFVSKYQSQFQRAGIDDYLAMLAKKYRDDDSGANFRRALVFGAIGSQTLDTEGDEGTSGMWSAATQQVKDIEHLAKMLKVRDKDVEVIKARTEGEGEVQDCEFSITKYQHTWLDECEALPADE
jgi:hypothetical protein